MDLNTARKNNFVISVSKSQLLDTIIDIVRGGEFSQNDLERIWRKRTSLKRKKKTPESYKTLVELTSQIDSLLFVPELISVTFEHVAHYRKIVKDGLSINGEKYVRLMAGAGQLRRKTVLFVKSSLSDKLFSIFENGVDKSKEISMSKFGAYTGLYSSAGRKVRTPRYIVIKDKEITRKDDLVHFVNSDNTVEEKTMDVTLNVFDGMGLISMDMAKEWREDLGLDYDAVQFIIRAPYIKGLLASFPFKTFAQENNISTITDIYGTIHNIDDVDVILTESQFKMSSYYSSLEEHKSNSVKNKLNWYITRTNPKKEKSNIWTSYQYIQVCKNSINIENLVKDTLEYFEDVSSLDADKSLIYFTGDTDTDNIEFSRIDNYHLKLLSLDKRVIRDPYIRKHIVNTLNKKIKESYSGKIMIDGHYSFMMADPYALSQHAFGIEVSGILKEGEFFSQYWNDKDIKRVSAGRSPLTWRSELCTLDFISNQESKKWLSHLTSGVVLNIFGNDIMKFADSDYDGDMIWTSSNEEIINNTYGGIPVTYDKRKVPKTSFDYSVLPKIEEKSFGTKIGLITNFSTTLSALLPFYTEGSKQYQEIMNRLIVCRKLQGESIDSVKGLEISELPKWSKNIKDNELHNELLLKKRPFFMRYLYQYKNKEFVKHHKIYNVYSWVKFGLSIDDLLLISNPTEEQSVVILKYDRYSPLILSSDSVMERLSRYMVEKVKEIKVESRKNEFDYSVYMNKRIGEDDSLKEPLLKLIREYNKIKKNLYRSDDFENKQQVFEYIKGKVFEISYDLDMLTNMVVVLCYRDGKNENFLHDIFEDGVMNNVMRNKRTFRFPVEDINGEVEFCYKKYSIKNFDL